MSDTPRSDAAAIEASGGCDDNAEGQSLVSIRFARTLEREGAVLRELLGRFAEFERDNDGYCEWCGTYPEQGHAADCIYPEVRAALRGPEGEGLKP